MSIGGVRDPDFNDCDEDAYCVNSIGSYNCFCHQGYRGNGSSCRDINECAEHTYVCHKKRKLYKY